jgi:DNA-binding NtrC family response regulator
MLVADDDTAVVQALTQALSHRGHQVTGVSTGAEALSALRTRPFDVALLDISMPSPDGLELLRAISDDAARPEVVIMTGEASIDTAVQAMRLGAIAYLSKPYRMGELDAVVQRAMERRRLTSENQRLRARLARVDGASPLASRSAAMRAVLAVAEQAAGGSAPMLVIGPAGVGKTALAEHLHQRSPRATAPFVVVTAGEMRGPHAAELLFGRVARGSASAAPAALSSAGTVYLTEVGALSAAVQRRLARALHTGSYRPEGGTELSPVRARVIVGSREPLEQLRPAVASDLIAELGSVRIELPPLLARREDIGPLAEAYVRSATDDERRLASEAVERLRAYDWPGNIAELRAVLDGALVVSPDRELAASDLPLGTPSALPLEEVERRHIAAVLRATDWHQGRAAEALGISPKTLYRKIREFGFQRPGSEAGV